MATKTRPRSHKFTPDQWLEHKELIQELWIRKRLNFLDVAAELGKVGFHPTKRQFEFQVSKWGFSKYVKGTAKNALILQHEASTDLRRLNSIFANEEYITCNNARLSKKNLVRWLKRNAKQPPKDTVTSRAGSSQPIHREQRDSLAVQSPPDLQRDLAHGAFSRGQIVSLGSSRSLQIARAVSSAHKAQLRCDYVEAEMQYRQSAHCLHASKHPVDEHFILVYAQVAVCQFNAGNTAEALATIQSLDVIGSTKLNTNDARRLRIRQILGAIHCSNGHLEAAEQCCEEVLQAAMQAYGATHRITLAAMASLAGALKMQDRLQESQQLYLKVLTARAQARGAEFDACQEARHLADILSDFGRVDESIQLYRTAEERAISSLGRLHHVTLRIQSNLAADLRIAGHLEESEKLLRSTFAKQRALLGQDHPDCSWTLYQHAKCLVAMERYAEALMRLENIVVHREQRLGKLHIRTINCYIWIGWCLERVHRPASAVAQYQYVQAAVDRAPKLGKYSDTYRMRWLRKAVARTQLMARPEFWKDSHLLDATLHDAADRLEISNQDGSPVQCVIEEESNCAETCSVIA